MRFKNLPSMNKINYQRREYWSLSNKPDWSEAPTLTLLINQSYEDYERKGRPTLNYRYLLSVGGLVAEILTDDDFFTETENRMLHLFETQEEAEKYLHEHGTFPESWCKAVHSVDLADYYQLEERWNAICLLVNPVITY